MEIALTALFYIKPADDLFWVVGMQQASTDFFSPPQAQTSFLLNLEIKLPRCSGKTASKAALMGEAGTGNMQQGNEEEKEEVVSLCDLCDLLSSR